MIMKRLLSALFIFQSLLCSSAAKQPFIPQPAEYTVNDGFFIIPDSLKISSNLSPSLTNQIISELEHPFKLSENNPDIILSLDPSIGEEGYTLNIKPKSIQISASNDKGLYYGIQSLYQLFNQNGRKNKTIQSCYINDYPRFQYRALMLDPVRYFIPKEEVKKIIDIASSLKFNTLHMHLSDDNGWRLEIKKYPKLTEVGAWRVDREEYFPGRMNQQSPEEPTPVGGYYSQEDMKEIVEYASEKYINVIPEIEMPAHAAAAIASYPELACPVVDKFVGVFPGIGGPDASIIMCGGNDKVYDFYCDVLDEVIDIFPSQYIHLGGDEADKSIWKECPLCNSRIKNENLDGYEGLQAYFMDRINSYVKSKGRTSMGWDEVTYGNPKEEMVILGWQGDGNVAVKDAAKSGRKFVMTPAKTLYLIRYQGPQWFEPMTYFGNNTMKDAYEYEPVKENWSPELKKLLLGIQGSLWTEFCNSDQDVEYLLFPRLIAIADASWRPEKSANYQGFLNALDNFLPELDKREICYAKSMYNIQHKALPTGESVKLDLVCERPDVEIIYSTENGEEKFNNPLFFTKPVKLTANTYLDGKPVGKELHLNLNFNSATGKKVSSKNCKNNIPEVLTNGLRGSEKHSDFEWAGWHGEDAEFIIDLENSQKINNCILGTIGSSDFCVAMPSEVTIFGSEDGKNYSFISSFKTPEELIYAKGAQKFDINFGNLDVNARYLKFVAKNPGRVPEGFPRWGAPVWIYFDEVIVN